MTGISYSNTFKEVFLTFDVEGPAPKEDIIDERTIESLYRILKLLEKYGLKGIFFVNCNVIESIVNWPKVLEMLRTQEIGYHSSSHSVRPCIFEYTDIESYSDAMHISLIRETSRIDPSSGEIEGEGGILLLRKIFPEKNILSFRAPFCCWTPPHTEALKKLGIKFDFSANISEKPILFKGITFYPNPFPIDEIKGKFTGFYSYHTKDETVSNKFLSFINSIMKKKTIVLLAHPAHMVYQRNENTYSYYKDSNNTYQRRLKSVMGRQIAFIRLELLLIGLRLLQKLRIVSVTPSLKESRHRLGKAEIDLKRFYGASVVCRNIFGYEPKFLFSHFEKFFDYS